MGLTQRHIGQRLMQLRKAKGLSQHDVAIRIRISRPSLAQIELGNRGINIFELQRLAEILEFSMDDFLSVEFQSPEPDSVSAARYRKNRRGTSTPKLKADKLRNVLLYILEQCAGKPNVGETVLYKLLYFSDFNYYELHGEHLTGARYRKLPFGPVPQGLDAIIAQMIVKKQLQRIKTEYHDYKQTRYIPLDKADLTQLRASEKEVVDKVLGQMSDWSAAAISKYSHKDVPWLATGEGEDIDYGLALYREAPFSVRNYGKEMEEK
jgi:transcriptional regulator with XRE-family HTH domain